MNDNPPAQQDGNLHSFADSFHCPDESAPPPPPPKKAQRRRKRHAPPGPAGVWFQSQLVNTTNASSSSDTTGIPRTQHAETSMAAPDVSSCPAWMYMQTCLNLCTPYLPRHYTVQERFQHLRPLLPSDYILLPEILQPSSSLLLENKSLLVLVHAAAVQYHSYWTMELRDECGASIKAWMDPLLEETEILHLLQMGVVWHLQDLKVLVDSVTQTKWLLISKGCIQQTWTPTQASSEFSDAHYIEWMTKRSLIHTTSSNGRMEQQQQQEEEEQEEHFVIDVNQHTHRPQDKNLNEQQEDDDVAAIPSRNVPSRSVVTPRVTTISSSTAPPRLPAAAAADKVDNRVLRQGVGDLPHATSSSGGTRRVSMSQQPPRASLGGGAATIPPLVNNNNTGSQSTTNPYASKARKAHPEESLLSLPANPTISTRPTTTASVSRALPLNHSAAPPTNMNGSTLESSKSRAMDFSQFRSPTTSNTSRDTTTQGICTTTESAATYANEETNNKVGSIPKGTLENGAPSTLPTTRNVDSLSQPPSSSFLSQFAAGSSQDQESPNSSPGGESTTPEPSPKHCPPSIIQKLTKRTKLQKTRSSKSPKNNKKPPSNLWLGADTCMMDDMLNDDEENQVNSQPQSCSFTRQETTVPNVVPGKESIPQEPSTCSTLAVDPPQASSSLFQASAFAGMDMDSLFDDDDE